MIFGHFRSLSIRKRAFVNSFGSVYIISRLDSQSEFQMFTLFNGRHVGCPPTWRLHTRFCNLVWNISTNISALWKRTHLELGELSSLFIVYNITIFWLYPLHSFWFYFLLRDSAHTPLNLLWRPLSNELLIVLFEKWYHFWMCLAVRRCFLYPLSIKYQKYHSVTNSTGATQRFSANRKTSSEQNNRGSFIWNQSQMGDLMPKVVCSLNEKTTKYFPQAATNFQD